MAALLGYNRKLAWVVISSLLWACLGLSLALGASRGGPPPFAMRLGLPPGGVVVPGHLQVIEETATGLNVTAGIPPEQLPDVENWANQQATKFPENLKVTFTALERLRPGQQPSTEYHLLDPANTSRQFGRHREVVMTKYYIVIVLPTEARFLPRGRESEAFLRRLIEERPRREDDGGDFWRREKSQEDGPAQPGDPWRERGDVRTGAAHQPPDDAPPPDGAAPPPPDAPPHNIPSEPQPHGAAESAPDGQSTPPRYGG